MLNELALLATIVVVETLLKTREPELNIVKSDWLSPNKALPVISKAPVVDVEMPTPKPLETVS
jgi:hypothetical protein